MQNDAPALVTLEKLATSADIRDRAFAASALALRRRAEDSAEVARLYDRIRATAQHAHRDLRQRIRDKSLDRRDLLAQLQETPLEIRDHLIEEILDVAYPPLEETALREVIHYAPSGLSEILFTIENAGLRPGKSFVDLGSGLGKVVLLVALLTGAQAYGVELDSRRAGHARAAAEALELDNARFLDGDIRDVPLPLADVYYMYIPLMRSGAVAERLMRIAARKKIVLFAQPLDLTHLPWLKASTAASYWLEMYEGV
jgi:SAM-dependent methyltransferase